VILNCLLINGYTQQSINLQYNRIFADVVSFQGDIGLPYTIETSTNLSDWILLRGLNGTPTGYQCFTNYPTNRILFYRASTPTFTEVIKMWSNPDAPQPTLVYTGAGANEDEADRITVAVYDLTSTNITTTLRKLNVYMQTINENASFIFPTLYLYNGSTHLASSSTISNSTTSTIGTFNDLNLALPANTIRTLTVKTDVRNMGLYTNGVRAYSSLYASGVTGGYSNNPVIVDINNIEVGVKPTIINGGTNLFNRFGAQHELVWLTATPGVFPNGVKNYEIYFVFKLSARGGDVFLNRTPVPISLAASTGANILSTTWIIGSGLGPDDSISEGNTAIANLSVILENTDNLPTPKTLSVIAIRYGDSSINRTNHTIDYGLESFTKTVQF
jgi:hypothetical protein